jgi:hypothetical protein
VSETFPFGADSGADTAGGNRTKIVALVGGALALVLVGVFVLVPMLTGGDDTPTAVPRANRKATTQTKGKPAKPAAKPAAKPVAPVATFQDDIERDPFKPLYVAPVAAPNPGLPNAGPGPAPANPVNPAPGSGSSAQIGSNRVSLLDVFVRDGKTFAQTRVNSTVHTPAVGSDFASSYKVLSASGTCATYLYGDEQFRLCEGQEVLK